jgi:hypothetical protein
MLASALLSKAEVEVITPHMFAAEDVFRTSEMPFLFPRLTEAGVRITAQHFVEYAAPSSGATRTFQFRVSRSFGNGALERLGQLGDGRKYRAVVGGERGVTMMSCAAIYFWDPTRRAIRTAR